MGSVLTVDIHCHVLPAELPNFSKQFGYGNFISYRKREDNCIDMMQGEKFFRTVEPNLFDTSVRLKEADRDNVKVQVLSTVPVMFSYWAKPEDTLKVAQFLNDDIAQRVSDNPNRFVGLGSLPMQSPEHAIEELDRCIKDLGLAGVEIGSHIEQWNLSDEYLFPIFKRAEELGAAIFVHPWDMPAKEQMEKYWLPWLVMMPAETSRAICSMIFGGIFERLPKLRVAFAHGGGSFPMTIGRIEHGYKVRPDLVQVDNKVNPRKYLGRFWVDSLVHDQRVLDYLVSLLGEDFVCLGTDYPFPLGELEPGKLIVNSGFPDHVKTKMLGTNALKWLNVSPQRFG